MTGKHQVAIKMAPGFKSDSRALISFKTRSAIAFLNPNLGEKVRIMRDDDQAARIVSQDLNHRLACLKIQIIGDFI